MNRGNLYLVSTPIGNLEDITLRAIKVLKEVDLIAAEDTRRTRHLLFHHEIKKPLISYHEHNKWKRAPLLIQRLLEGKKIAIVSDSGTPGISDPCYLLVNLAIKEKVKVVPIPGASSLLSGLVVSGLPTDRFIFEGFLPRKKKKREKRLLALSKEERTIVLFESPHRILSTLEDLLSFLGDREAAIARELTKIHEEIQRGSLSHLLEIFRQRKPRGEIVVILRGRVVSDEASL